MIRPNKTLACSQLHPTAKQFLLALRFFGSAKPQSFGKPETASKKSDNFLPHRPPVIDAPNHETWMYLLRFFLAFLKKRKPFSIVFESLFFRWKITSCKPWSTRNWFRMLLLGAAASWSDYFGQSLNHKIIAPHVKRWDLRQFNEANQN